MNSKAFTVQLANAIENCGQSRYAISKATGVPQSTLSRLVNTDSGWIGRKHMDTLIEYLGLKLIKER